MVIFKLMKKVFGAMWRRADAPTFQQRAIKQFDKISEGDKIMAPKHPTDQRVFKEAIQDQSIKKEVNRKNDNLINQVNQITIKSTDPERSNLSTEREPLHHVDPSEMDFPKFEYGFYELPTEKLGKNHLSFREALEILRARLDAEMNVDGRRDPEAASSSATVLENHPAVKRVDPEKLENMWRYFRPFVRREKQMVIPKKNLDDLRYAMEGKHDVMDIVGNPMNLLKEMLVHKKLRKGSLEQERFDFLEEEEQEKFVQAAQEKRREEFLRLEKRLLELHELDDEIQREEKGRLEEEGKKDKQISKADKEK